jgi:3-deoxy-D-manno-octulosonate 8-phosphate phosphatase (KDO 8-P phosphatase)
MAGDRFAAPGAAADPGEDVRRRAARVRLAAFDVDGTLTDGRLWLDGAGVESKAYHIHDGLGLKLLQDNGIAVAFITARESPSARARARDLGITHVFTGVRDKRACLEALCAQLGIALDEVAYMGDDLADLCVFAHVGLAVAPANLHHWLRGQVHWTTPAHGGEGAARALCDLVLEERGLRAALLSRYGAP